MLDYLFVYLFIYLLIYLFKYIPEFAQMKGNPQGSKMKGLNTEI